MDVLGKGQPARRCDRDPVVETVVLKIGTKPGNYYRLAEQLCYLKPKVKNS